jgi:hypothetical protein
MPGESSSQRFAQGLIGLTFGVKLIGLYWSELK